MATITIRKLDKTSKLKLRVRAAQRGRSMEEEAREILCASLAASEQPQEGLASAIRRRFAPLKGVDLQLPERGPVRNPGR